MPIRTIVQSHIATTETLVRLYFFLAQHMHRCLSETARLSYPEHELQSYLAVTRTEALDILSVNPVVKRTIEQECDRVFRLAAACRTEGAPTPGALEEWTVQRTILKHKTVALSDVLAVFRAAQAET